MNKLIDRVIILIILFNILIFLNVNISYCKYVIETRNEAINIKFADSEKPSINGRKYDIDYENFNTSVTVNYNDNTNIKYAKYWFNPIDKIFDDGQEKDFISNTTFEISGWYKVEVSDLYNNKTSYIFLIDKEFNEVALSVTATDDNGSNFKIIAKDNLTGVQKLEVYIAGNLYKTFTYDEWFSKEKIEEFQVPVSEIDFYEKVYVKAVDFYGNTKSSSEYIPNKTRIWDVIDFIKFREIVNNKVDNFNGSTIYLLNDINLNSCCSIFIGTWIPIGTHQKFAGIFNGNNHTISNLYISSSGNTLGLFGEISGIIKNLKVSGQIKRGGDYVGGIVGYIDKGGTIENCINNVQIEIKERNNIGGIAGFNHYGDIKKCSNSASITGNDFVGGIVRI